MYAHYEQLKYIINNWSNKHIYKQQENSIK